MDFKAFLAKGNKSYESIVNKVSEISEEDDWMSSEKIDILINEIRGLRKDLNQFMAESANQHVDSGYGFTNESVAAPRQKPRIVAHKPGGMDEFSPVGDGAGHGSDFDSHVAALC